MNITIYSLKLKLSIHLGAKVTRYEKWANCIWVQFDTGKCTMVSYELLDKPLPSISLSLAKNLIKYGYSELDTLLPSTIREKHQAFMENYQRILSRGFAYDGTHSYNLLLEAATKLISIYDTFLGQNDALLDESIVALPIVGTDKYYLIWTCTGETLLEYTPRGTNPYQLALHLSMRYDCDELEYRKVLDSIRNSLLAYFCEGELEVVELGTEKKIREGG